MEEEKREDEPALEEMMDEIERILERLERGELSLEESFSLYAQGMEKLKRCSRAIDGVEKKMLILEKESDEGNDIGEGHVV